MNQEILMLDDYPKEIVLKNGNPILLRPAVGDDEERLNRFFSAMPADERWFLRDNMADPAVVHQLIQELDYNRVLPMIALDESGEEVIANLRLHRRPARCLSHVAHLRVMVHPEYRGVRLGTWMLLDAVKLAMDMGIEKLVAEFVAGVEDTQRAAILKLDFTEQAVLKDYVKDPVVGYRDLIITVKNLHRDWSDF
jgi:GNAT superfamily N-acetyltransferase